MSDSPTLSKSVMVRLCALVAWAPASWPEVFEQLGLVAEALTRATPSQRTRLRYAATRDAGLLQRRKARETGALVSIYDNTVAEIEVGEPDLPYFLVCEPHGFCVGTSTLEAARAWAAAPSGWCDECRDRKKEHDG